MDTTKIKDGITVVAMLAAVVAAFVVYRKLSDSAASASVMFDNVINAITEPVQNAIEAVQDATVNTMQQSGTVSPNVQGALPRYDGESDTDYEIRMFQLQMLAAGGMGA